MDKVRLGIVGLKGMGALHANYVLAGKINRCELAAVCDVAADTLKPFEKPKKFTDSREMIRSGDIDAILIATPHYFHTSIGIDALQGGLHVLVEKPVSVHKADCERLMQAHTNPKQVFAAMFNLRTDPHYKKIKKLVDDGDLGEIRRLNWIITDWFRTEAYYASGGWRGTWAGEGGGVLLNQCPHQLDLLQWFCGMPSRVHGFCKLGSRHSIEVEDEVTAFLEYANGATGVFVTSTGEAPGTNRLEIAGEKGRVSIENSKITFIRNEVPMSEFSRASKLAFARPDTWTIDIPVNGVGGQHTEITQNFVDAILDGTPLIAPAEEGIKSIELANSMLYSSLTGKPVDMPLDGKAFEATLKKLVAESKFKKKVVATKGSEDLSSSFTVKA